MPKAAVPAYLGNDFRAASPGLRFGLLLPIWTDRADQEKEVKDRAEARSKEAREVEALLQRGMDYAIEQLCQRERRPLPGLWEKNDFAAREAWKNVKALSRADVDAMRALVERQRAAAAATAHGVLHLQAVAIAPFATGLGNEHPLENGFAFLNPYGVPYLPGSGVKGVVRRAAQELASGLWESDRGWRGLDAPQYSIERERDGRRVAVALSIIDVLFGREPPSGDRDHVRGALAFWDVIPQIKGDSLMVEIMTPHQSHYYQQKRDPKNGDSVSPHDSGQPNPISFLTVPPGSTFDFHVVCDLAHLARLTASRQAGAPDLLAEGATHWKTLLAAAFAHAFEWLGFGAKTAVGYGAMQARSNAAGASSGGPATAAGATASRETSVKTETWESAKLSWNPGSQEMKAATSGRVTAPLRGTDTARALFANPTRFDQLKKKGELKNVRVEVRIDGNFTVIVRVH